MDLIKECKIFNSDSVPFKARNVAPEGDNKLWIFKNGDIEMSNMSAEAERSVIESIWQDDRARFVSSATTEVSADRCFVSSLLRFCCTIDSVECATALVNGEVGGAVPVVNEADESGLTALHVAAEMQAARCVDLLLRKRARTDLKTKDGRSQLALDLSLSSLRADVTWCPDESSIEDLVVLLSEKDLTTLRLLSEKTIETAEVAYANAIDGCMVSLTALLIVATKKVNETILELRDSDSGAKEKTTVYECVIREALALGRGEVTPSIAVKRTSTPSKSEIAQKRKLLLREIELLQLFGAVAQSACQDKTPLLIRAAQAGDETIIQMLVKTDIDVNDTDAEGNSALHWFLKTSKSSAPQQMKILSLLLRQGAKVNQKNMMGLTAVHIAAANGNSEALQALLLGDPNAINYKTEMKETPLFFAVKNDHIDCVDLLLRWGANSEVLNLRRQRSIDLASSQDMRFMLNPVKISHMNRSFPGQQKHTAGLPGEDLGSETRKSLLAMPNEGTPTDRGCYNAKTEICKYHESEAGCVRGSKCSFAHGKVDLRRLNLGKRPTHSIAAQVAKRKIFVGGLPLTLESDSLGEFFEGFGVVEDAVVVVVQTGDHIQSRGFGFVTFEDEKSATEAIEEHYVTIMGKQVEIKSVIPKFLIASQSQKPSPQQEKYEHHDQALFPNLSLPQEKCEQNDQQEPQPQFQNSTPQPEISDHNDQHQPRAEVPIKKTTEEAKPEPASWANRVLQGQPKTCCSDSQADRGMPGWLQTFKKWFPGFLKYVTAHREEHYALSSLKADFRAKFGIDMDHASLGYAKLSDFMRSFPGLCHMRIAPVGGRGHATHIILLPKPPVAPSQPVQITKPSVPTTLADNNSDGHSSGSKCLEDTVSVSSENLAVTSASTEGNMSRENAGVNSAPNVSSSIPCKRFLEFTKLDPLIDARSWVHSGNIGAIEDTGDERGGWIEEVRGIKLMYHKRHLVLEALSRKWNNSSVFFLREFDFYHKYKASLERGVCFGCNEQRMIWANSPCHHFLWCEECKKEAAEAAGFFEHKCVVCDRKVQSLDLIPWNEYCQATCHDVLGRGDQFPPLNPYHMMSQSENRPPPLVGY